jgi:hypothetical protein
MSQRWATTLLRALVFALALPLASSGALPFWVQIAGIEAPHVCHCSVDKHDCVCARCNPDHEEELLVTSESLKGRCGDDDVAFGGKALCAVLPPASVLAPVAAHTTIERPSILLLSELVRPPPTPPPRQSSSAA